MIRMEDAGRLKRALFRRFMDLARRVGPEILDGRPVGWADRLGYAAGEALVYGPLRNVLGLSRIRVGYTAGEAIGPEIFGFYRAIGVNLKQLYGQTEASVFITQQPDGEVQGGYGGGAEPGGRDQDRGKWRGFIPFSGGLRGVFPRSGGDGGDEGRRGLGGDGGCGVIDAASGQLRIIDRAKDVGRMADGSLFAPKYVENKLKFYPNILEAVVFGRGRGMVTAFVNIDLAAVGNWAERNGIAYGSYQELAGLPRVYAMVREHVEEVNRSLAADPALAGCQVGRFLILHKELDADDGELTPDAQGAAAGDRGEVCRPDPGALRRVGDGGDRDRGHLRGRAEGGDPGDAEDRGGGGGGAGAADGGGVRKSVAGEWLTAVSSMHALCTTHAQGVCVAWCRE